MAKNSKTKPAKKSVSKAGAKGSSVVPFFYVKSPDFRTIHLDGAIGGPTPRGLIHFAVYSERQAIPQRIDIEVGDGGKLGQEVAREGKNGILRELQCDVVMDLNAAVSFAAWLNRNIEMLKQAIDKQKKQADTTNGQN